MKKTFFRTIAKATGIAALTLLAGCTTSSRQNSPVQDENGVIHMKRPDKDKIVYEQISTTGCKLAPLGDLNAVSGTPYELELMLTNASGRNITIKEWYMIDQYNFIVHYRKLPADRPVNAGTPFKKYQVHIPVKPQPHHSELRLAPGEKAQFTLRLPFVEELSPGESAAFEVYVTTTLETFKLKGGLFLVTAR